MINMKLDGPGGILLAVLLFVAILIGMNGITPHFGDSSTPNPPTPSHLAPPSYAEQEPEFIPYSDDMKLFSGNGTPLA